MFKRVVFGLLSLSLLAASGLAAEAESKFTPDEPDKGGAYRIEGKGVPLMLWTEIQAAYGATIKPELVKKAREPDSWLVLDDGKPSSWQVIVPSSYKRGEPHGVLVFVSAGDSGDLPGAYKTLLGPHRLIAIGANNSGNSQSVPLRQAYAVYGVELLRQRYDIDPDRIYITGTSGGGRLTSHAMLMHSDVFTGAIPLIGANNYRMFWQRPDIKRLARARRDLRIALMTGEKDFNKPGTQEVYQSYKSDGFKHITYLEQPGLGHTTPSAEWFEKAIVFLDAPLIEAARASYDAAVLAQRRSQLGDALAGYSKAAAHGRGQDFAAQAATSASELRQQYDAALAEARQLMSGGKFPEAQRAILELRKQWGAHAADDVKTLTQELIEARKAAIRKP